MSGGKHMGKNCRRSKKCDIPGCTKVHHRLLNNIVELNPGAPVFQPDSSDNMTLVTQSYTASDNEYVALRTIPIMVSVNGKEMHLKALLDDGSTKTYLNRDVAAELGLDGDRSIVHVNVLNGKCEFETLNVTFQLKSIDNTLQMNITVQTAEQIT